LREATVGSEAAGTVVSLLLPKALPTPWNETRGFSGSCIKIGGGYNDEKINAENKFLLGKIKSKKKNSQSSFPLAA
jgi:hypothetical protein